MPTLHRRCIVSDVNAGELHRLARVLREIATAATADPGEPPVSAGDLAIAEDIAHHEGAAIGEIAQRTGLAQSLVSKTVAAMREAGVVATAPDPADGRRMLVRIHPVARADLFRVRAARPIDAAILALRPGLTEVEMSRIEALLDELADHLVRRVDPPRT
jgi:DNA-binding MarR family transcriptional regulator